MNGRWAAARLPVTSAAPHSIQHRAAARAAHAHAHAHAPFGRAQHPRSALRPPPSALIRQPGTRYDTRPVSHPVPAITAQAALPHLPASPSSNSSSVSCTSLLFAIDVAARPSPARTCSTAPVGAQRSTRHVQMSMTVAKPCSIVRASRLGTSLPNSAFPRTTALSAICRCN